jgi:hypothetical protein
MTGDGKKVLSGTNRTVFRRQDKMMPHCTLLRCICAAGTMMPPMLVVPGLKSAEIEWRGLVFDGRMLVKSSPRGWVKGPLFEWLAQVRLGIEPPTHRGERRMDSSCRCC